MIREKKTYDIPGRGHACYPCARQRRSPDELYAATRSMKRNRAVTRCCAPRPSERIVLYTVYLVIGSHAPRSRALILLPLIITKLLIDPNVKVSDRTRGVRARMKSRCTYAVHVFGGATHDSACARGSSG